MFGLSLLFLTGCTNYREVVFKGVESVSVGRFDQQGMQLTADVRLENPNNFRIKVSDPDVDVFLNGFYLGKAHLDERVILPKRTDATYHVPLHADFDGTGSNVLTAMLSAALSGKGELRVKGTVTGGIGFLLRKKFPFEETETIDLRSSH